MSRKIWKLCLLDENVIELLPLVFKISPQNQISFFKFIYLYLCGIIFQEAVLRNLLETIKSNKTS